MIIIFFFYVTCLCSYILCGYQYITSRQLPAYVWYYNMYYSKYKYTLVVSANTYKVAPHSNSLYFCWSCQNRDVLKKPHDQHPIRHPCDQSSDQHPFLPQISFFQPHMTNNVTNSPRSPLICCSLRG